MTKFQEFMDQHNLSQYRFHKLTGFTKGQISEWQRGIHRPSIASARRIAVALRLPIDVVLGQLEVRERVQNSRTESGSFVPKTKKIKATSTRTNDPGRTPHVYCLHCRQPLAKAA